MIKTLLNYTILSVIYDNSNSIAYRALRNEDNRTVVIKLLKTDYPSPTELNRFRHEFEILSQLNISGAIQVYELQTYQNSLALIVEDFGGESLAILSDQYPFTIEEWVRLFIQTAHSLNDIHAVDLIHKDINPNNIVCNIKIGQVKFIDFGLASRLPRENLSLQSPNQLEGTLAYLSPEQTGRMNRVLDYRSDLYSLGVTFYELLTGQLPFISTDPLEVLHAHLAKQPTPPHDINPHIPRLLSDVILKLMAKNAEDRYQSAFGLKYDLEQILINLNDLKDFELAQQDISGKFHLPQKLYGRDAEIASLWQAFDRISQGSAELMLIVGYSGIGKTALVQELYKPLTAKHGYFIAGKFDQFQRSNIPYSAIVSAFRSLVQQLLTESAHRLEKWQRKLLKSLDNHGQVVIDVIPEIELIIGKQIPVPILSPTESQTRFNLVFQNFIKTFCSPKHPLVIFLDDLQWADLATLKLLELLVSNKETNYLLVIGAYRDNEVDAVHPLSQMLTRISPSTTIKQLHLVALQLIDISDLLIDVLHREEEEVQPLVALIMQKTRGNPFFISQFLKTLYQQQLLIFQPFNQQWYWHLDQLETLNITDNVVDLMITNLKQLSDYTQENLRLAACVGNQFNLSILALIENKAPDEVLKTLQPALRKELIVPISGANQKTKQLHYRFLHDRIQQAAYALIPENEKPLLHIKIGYLLLKNTKKLDLETRIFDIVHHLNFGLNEFQWIENKEELASLNLLAGKKARQSAAFGATLQYLQAAVSCLNEKMWKYNYDLTVEIYKSYAEAEFLNSHFEQSAHLISILENHLKTNVEKAETLLLLVVQKTIEAKCTESVEIARRAFHLLNIDLPTPDTVEIALKEALEEASNLLSDRDLTFLQHLPENQQPIYRLITQLLISVEPAIYLMGDLNLYMYVSVKATALSLRYGNVVESSKAYANYGLITGSGLGDFARGYQFGLLAVEVSKHFHSLAYESKADLLLGSWIQSWSKPVCNAKKYNLDGYHAGMAAGEVQFGIYNIFGYITNSWVEGTSLEELQNRINEYLPVLYKAKNDMTMDTVLGIQLCILYLIGQTEQVTRYDQVLSEEEFHPFCKITAFSYATYCTFKAQSLYLFDKIEEALLLLKSAQTILGSIFGYTSSFEYNFYFSLTLLKRFEKTQNNDDLKLVEINQVQLEKWARSCPENFLHKWSLVAAEQARLNNDHLKAIDYYEQAIELATKHNFIQDQALANELMAKFWLSKNKEKIAKVYLQEAFYCYQRWGATAKLIQLQDQYFQLLIQSDIASSVSLALSRSNNIHGLDLNSIIKASQTFAGEIVLQPLLEKMMHIVIETAGANKGFLLLSKQGKWFIEARGCIGKEHNIAVLQSLSLEDDDLVSPAIVHYVARTQQPIILNDATKEGHFTQDTHIVNTQIPSVLCIPLKHQGKLNGILYLENHFTTDAFTPARLEILNVLSSQIAVSLENALLYAHLEQKLLELADKNQTLVRFNKEKNELLAIVAHDLKNPLSGILGLTDVMADSMEELSKQEISEYINDINLSAKQMFDLIINLLDVNRIESGKFNISLQPTDLFLVVQKIIKDYQERANAKKINIHYQAEETPHLALLDPTIIRQALDNLISNAIKYSPLEKNIYVRLIQNEQQIRCEIQDEGDGLNEEDKQKLFSKFARLSAKPTGGEHSTGLGLFIVKKLVTLMNGQVWCESDLGKGATFIIKFTKMS